MQGPPLAQSAGAPGLPPTPSPPVGAIAGLSRPWAADLLAPSEASTSTTSWGSEEVLPRALAGVSATLVHHRYSESVFPPTTRAWQPSVSS